jgi:hypothetical protein
MAELDEPSPCSNPSWTTNANPEGVEFPSLPMFNPFRVGSTGARSHGYRLARHPWLFRFIPSGDALKL